MNLSPIITALNKIASQMSNIAINIFSDQKNYASSAYLTSDSAVLVNAVYTKLSGFTKQFDPENLIDLTNSKWVAPVSGYYQINCNITFINALNPTQLTIAIYKNGVIYHVAYDHTAMTNGAAVNISSILYLEKGDYIEFYGRKSNASATSCVFQGNSAVTYFNIAKLNSYISPTPTQTQAKCSGYINTDQLNLVDGTYTKVNFNTKLFDPKNDFNVSTNLYTCSESGYYQINSIVLFTSTVINKQYDLAIYKNGVIYRHDEKYSTLAGNLNVGISQIIYLDKGDTIGFYVRSLAGVNTVDIYGLETYSNFSIHKLSD